MSHDFGSSVGGGIRERRGRESDTRVGGVVNVVEPLEERVAVDEVEALARVRAEVRRDEVDAAGAAADSAVELRDGRVRGPFLRESGAEMRRGGDIPNGARSGRWG